MYDDLHLLVCGTNMAMEQRRVLIMIRARPRDPSHVHTSMCTCAGGYCGARAGASARGEGRDDLHNLATVFLPGLFLLLKSSNV